jgi:hypothetical protein
VRGGPVSERLAASVLLLTAVLLCAREGVGLVLCTTPDGKTYAGDKPPPDCKVRSEYANPPEPALSEPASEPKNGSDQSFEAEAIVLRRRIEDAINRAADDLIAARDALVTLDSQRPDFNTWTQAQIDNYWTVYGYWASKESDARAKISRLRSDFASLVEQVRAQNHGSLPSTWRRPLNCQNCP